MTAEPQLSLEDGLRLAEVRSLCRTGEARRIRTAAGLTLAEVAQIIGDVAPVSIFRWERGARSPSIERALRYLDLLEELDRINGSR